MIDGSPTASYIIEGGVDISSNLYHQGTEACASTEKSHSRSAISSGSAQNTLQGQEEAEDDQEVNVMYLESEDDDSNSAEDSAYDQEEIGSSYMDDEDSNYQFEEYSVDSVYPYDTNMPLSPAFSSSSRLFGLSQSIADGDFDNSYFKEARSVQHSGQCNDARGHQKACHRSDRRNLHRHHQCHGKSRQHKTSVIGQEPSLNQRILVESIHIVPESQLLYSNTEKKEGITTHPTCRSSSSSSSISEASDCSVFSSSSCCSKTVRDKYRCRRKKTLMQGSINSPMSFSSSFISSSDSSRSDDPFSSSPISVITWAAGFIILASISFTAGFALGKTFSHPSKSGGLSSLLGFTTNASGYSQYASVRA